MRQCPWETGGIVASGFDFLPLSLYTLYMYKIQRSEAEVDEMLNRALDLEDSGENPYFGLTFAQGVEQGINWITGKMDEDPLPKP